EDVIYAHHILTTLRLVLERMGRAEHTDLTIHMDKILPQLYKLLITPSVQQMDKRTVATEPRLLIDAGRIITFIVQRMHLHQQKRLAIDLRRAYFDGHVDGLIGEYELYIEKAFLPFEPDAPESQRNLCILYAHPLFAMRKEVFDDAQETARFCNLLFEGMLSWSNELRHEPLCKLLASLLNKKAEVLSPFIDEILPNFWRTCVADGQATKRRVALRAWAWIMRGMIIRSDSRAYEGVANLIALLADNHFGKEAARILAVLSQEDNGVITKKNFAVTRMLYKQRFYSYILPRLVEGSKLAPDSAAATPYLIGLSSLLQSMPKRTMISELSKLVPLLLRALELNELDLRSHVIDTLALLVRAAPEMVKSQAATIVDTLIKNAVCADAKDSEAAVH
ncbi:MAG: hypothetical protein CYPHOPRED_005705, partial [Cyphobasidiales sp. Tagirdzhanova-0007]